MTAISFKYLFPMLVGYLLFAAISGQFKLRFNQTIPLDKPRWFLSIWTGLVSAIVVFVTLNLSYNLYADSLRDLAISSLSLLTALMLPGIAIFALYKRRLEEANWIDQGHMIIGDSEAALLTQELQQESVTDETQPGLVTGEYAGFTVNKNDYDRAFYLAFNAAADALRDSTVESNATQSLTQANPLHEDALSANHTSDTKAEKTFSESHHIKYDSELNFLHQARKLAREQYNLRCHAESSLRITRSALSKLETEARKKEECDADEGIHSEQVIQEKIREIAKVETSLLREQEQRQSMEDKLLDAKQHVLKAKVEVRKNMEARSKALKTARKAVTFAKRSLEAKTRAERQVEELTFQLKSQSTTNSSLIAALESERTNNKKSAGMLAAQMILQDKQKIVEKRKSKRMSSAGLLKNRLIKKVAKPRVKTPEDFVQTLNLAPAKADGS